MCDRDFPPSQIKLQHSNFKIPSVLLVRLLNLTLPTAAENLALDEALLEAAEQGELSDNVLRFWESPTYFVVLGRSSQPEVEVDMETCRRNGVEVYRRASGGGTVVSGPGCMAYAVVLGFETHPQLKSISHAHEFVLGRIAGALAQHVPGVTQAGTSDLVIDAGAGPLKKFSGNALRLKRSHLLYHGTILYDFDLERAERFLATPTRTPEYRNDRSHVDFITNLPLEKTAIQHSLLTAWGAQTALEAWPEESTEQLVSRKYKKL